MVNAWSLLYDELYGEDGMTKEELKFCVNTKDLMDGDTVTVPLGDINLDEDITIGTGNTATEPEHSPYYYDYNRNDPDRPDPFVDAFDHMMEDGYPSEFTTLSDNDDQMAHHIPSASYEELNLNIHANSPYNSGYEQDFYKEELKTMSDIRNKYHEKEILKEIEEYVSGTYNGHYTGTKHEYRNVQTIDLMASRDLASDFCQANILKYGSRYGSKDGRNKKDLHKVIHYAMLLLHFDEHYGKPSMTSGNIDHNMP